MTQTPESPMRTWHRDGRLQRITGFFNGRMFNGRIAALVLLIGMVGVVGGCKSSNTQPTDDASTTPSSAPSYTPEEELAEARRQGQSFGESVWTDVLSGPLYQ